MTKVYTVLIRYPDGLTIPTTVDMKGVERYALTWPYGLKIGDKEMRIQPPSKRIFSVLCVSLVGSAIVYGLQGNIAAAGAIVLAGMGWTSNFRAETRYYLSEVKRRLGVQE